MDIDAKRVPTWSPNRCKNASKINAKTGSEKYEENNENHVFPLCKTMPKHRTVVKKQGFARSGCGAGKSSKNVKNDE